MKRRCLLISTVWKIPFFEKAMRCGIGKKEQVSYPSKYYYTDTGLLNSRLHFTNLDESRIMENIVYNELRSRGYQVDLGVGPIKAGNDERTKHIARNVTEFIVDSGGNRYYIRCSPYADESETWAGLHAGDSSGKILVTKSPSHPGFDEESILHVGICDFLLDKSLLD